MKLINLSLILLIIIFSTSCAQNNKNIKSKKLKTELDSVSYALGVDIAENLKESDLDFVDLELFIKAMQDSRDSNLIFNVVESRQIMNDYFLKKQKEKLLERKEEGLAFLKKNANRKEIITTASGLQYEIIKKGNGSTPSFNDTVWVKYKGMLIDGTVFNSSDDVDIPAILPISVLISGWAEGIQLMPVGSIYKFYIPYNLAYGEKGNRGARVAPYTSLIFEVELIEINPSKSEK